jgi:LPXTG-motif cell wall-anchored protein
VAPKTGASATAAVVFAGLMTIAFAIAKRKNLIPTVRFE